MTKQSAYTELVRLRRACRACETHGLVNPSVCRSGMYDTNGHIGPWTKWQGNLDAHLMIVGQDWGGQDYYIKHQGLEQDENATNKNLISLLLSIGVSINSPCASKGAGSLFFTNAVLCLKPGGLSGPVHAACFDNCGRSFLKQQVELVAPKVVVTLGRCAYRALLQSYGLTPAAKMREAVARGQFEVLPNGAIIVPVYHPGAKGLWSRSFEHQKQDWQRVSRALESASRQN